MGAAGTQCCRSFGCLSPYLPDAINGRRPNDQLSSPFHPWSVLANSFNGATLWLSTEMKIARNVIYMSILRTFATTQFAGGNSSVAVKTFNEQTKKSLTRNFPFRLAIRGMERQQHAQRDNKSRVNNWESPTGSDPSKGQLLPVSHPKSLPTRVLFLIGLSDDFPIINGTNAKPINVNLINISVCR